jgi:hypothetical protein
MDRANAPSKYFIDELRPNLGQLRNFCRSFACARRARHVARIVCETQSASKDAVVVAMQRIARTPIRSISVRSHVSEAGFRCFTEKIFSSRKATRGLTPQALKLRARIEALRAKRCIHVFEDTQITLILSMQM